MSYGLPHTNATTIGSLAIIYVAFIQPVYQIEWL